MDTMTTLVGQVTSVAPDRRPQPRAYHTGHHGPCLVSKQITAFGQRCELATAFEWGSEMVTTLGWEGQWMTASGQNK